jgi:SAM-dependent methyltransferase
MGSGNCDFEIKIAKFLISKGYKNFQIECVDFNAEMMKRGKDAALENGVLQNMSFTVADANSWKASHIYEIAIANMALHHFIELETLFENIKDSLNPMIGRFIVYDMIGRNGHMRWPEALSIVNEYWPKMDNRYRFNNMLSRFDTTYINFDCSKSGFEGIRAQDILSLLHEKFHFESFFGFANLIECFVDRSTGPNFDPNKIEDCRFIDEIHFRDEAEMASGVIKPTHMLAVMASKNVELLEFFDPMTPEFSIRHPD